MFGHECSHSFNHSRLPIPEREMKSNGIKSNAAESGVFASLQGFVH